jgi:hypothetical protein
MRLISAFAWLSFIAATWALSGCDLLEENPTSGIAVTTKRCIQDPTVYPQKQCLAGTKLWVTPYIPVWGSKVSFRQGCVTPFS